LKATLRDGTTLEIGDEVETNFHKSCMGKIFIVCEIHPYDTCESKSMVVVHLKGEPGRRLEGFKKEGHVSDRPLGIDTNWFKKIK